MSDTEETPRRLPRWDGGAAPGGEAGGAGRPEGEAEGEAEPGVPAGGFDLGGLASGEADTTLGGGERAEAPAPQADEGLALPRGAMVGLRKSGGLRFSSRYCVVYRSGRVERGDEAGGPARPTYLSATEVKRLYRLLLRARLASWDRERPPASPDAYSYEIAARFGRNLRRVELADGGIPDAIEPLVRTLSRLLPT